MRARTPVGCFLHIGTKPAVGVEAGTGEAGDEFVVCVDGYVEGGVYVCGYLVEGVGRGARENCGSSFGRCS